MKAGRVLLNSLKLAPGGSTSPNAFVIYQSGVSKDCPLCVLKKKKNPLINISDKS